MEKLYNAKTNQKKIDIAINIRKCKHYGKNLLEVKRTFHNGKKVNLLLKI